jgi:type I restriction enzyme R subunit
VQLIDKRQRKPVYTDFEDLMGGETDFTLPGFAVGTDQAKFIAKARAFLRQHLDHVAVAKLRMNRPLTPSDLSELERLLGESGVGEPEDIRRAAENAQGLGLLVRSLVGMDRAAAKGALARFTNGKTLTANQLEFVNLIVDHLTEHGLMEAARLYESPFTDLTPHGPDGLFKSNEMEELLRALQAVRATAVAA